jgi:hypothetical protein
MQTRESGRAIPEQNSQTIRANRSQTGRIRGKINRPIIREILRRIISPRVVKTIRGVRTTTRTSGNDNSAIKIDTRASTGRSARFSVEAPLGSLTRAHFQGAINS